MLEKQIERKLCDEVDKLKGMCLKQNGIAGIPDRLVLLPMASVPLWNLRLLEKSQGSCRRFG